MRSLVVFALLLSFALPARASDATGDEPARASDATGDEPPSGGRRALAAGAAVVPGVLVHGAGHYALGQKSTARDLLLFESLGLGMILVGGGSIVLTGASRYVVGPAAGMTALGFGLFGTSLLADVYGSVSPDAGAARLRRPRVPLLETEFGYRRVEDVQFAHHDFVAQGLRLNHGALAMGLAGMFSLGADNARYRGEIGYHFLERDSLDRLELTAGFVRHLYAAERFNMTSGEIFLSGRYDLERIGPTLSGAFVEFGAGYARGAITYDLLGQRVPNDGYDLLLARFAFGARLRGLSGPGSEASLYYDHRHDDFAAGLKVTGLGSGVAGHFGAQAKWFFDSNVGVLADVSVGSAWVFGASLLLRQPAPRRAQGSRP